MDSAVQQFEATFLQHDLLSAHESLLVAVSGGVDSMVMLDLLARLAPKYDWQLRVAHINHQLRGQESDLDEALVKQVSSNYGFPCLVYRENVLKFKEEAKCSLEEAARMVRHKSLAHAALQNSLSHPSSGLPVMPKIALAHHADDQIELFFIRLLRGAGSVGLSGMDWKCASPYDARLQMVRPMLGVRRKWILEYAQQTSIRFRDDTSNFQNNILRNRIRHELIPTLESQYQAGLPENVLRTMEILGDESDLVSLLADQWMQEAKDQKEVLFENLHRAIQRVLLQKQLHHLGLSSDFQLIENLRTHPNRHFMITPEIIIYRNDQGWVQKEQKKEIAHDNRKLEINLSHIEGQVSFGQTLLRWKVQPRNNWSTSCFTRQERIECFDYDRVGRNIVVRNWMPGDRFQPVGMKAPVKLQDILTNLKVPRSQRHTLALGQAEDGCLFWVEDLRIGECYKVTDKTRVLLKWSWERLA